uniref:Oxygen-dependent protoporphyrinogen oxidase n=1 Tax=Candidatus Kentrum sp. DK TaxID=2126562 RepID=A0A450SWJ9_9GAMM|nr:MAG: oxygen-dependent protoporphyrinogen oxidase [Candidatus Kentron sp. DK]
MSTQPLQAAIIGGGISGLATAFFMQRLAPNARIAVFEQAPRMGGTMQSERRDGFLFEAGPNGFLSNRKETLDLVKDSGAESMLLRSNDCARIRYVFSDRLWRLPDTPPAFLGTGLLSFREKARVLGEFFIPPKRDRQEESVQAFGYRRLGRRFTDIFLDAMSAGIHAATPDRLSVDAAFPAVVALEREYGGLFRGMLKKRKKEAGPGGVLMSFRGGVGAFAEHLAAVLPVAQYTNTRVTEIAALDAGTGYRLTVKGAGSEETLAAQSVVLATPAFVSAELLAGLDGGIASQLRAICYTPVAVVGFGYYGLEHPLDGFGLLTTTAAGLPILGVLWDSSIFAGRAPPGGKSLRVLIGGQRNPELVHCEEAELIRLAREGIRNTMGIDAKPATTFVRRWRRGIPHYGLGHLDNVRDIHREIGKYPGLYLNSNAYFGVGLNDCVINSQACAKRWAEVFAP